MKDKSWMFKGPPFKNALRFCPTERDYYQTQNSRYIWGCQTPLFFLKTGNEGSSFWGGFDEVCELWTHRSNVPVRILCPSWPTRWPERALGSLRKGRRIYCDLICIPHQLLWRLSALLKGEDTFIQCFSDLLTHRGLTHGMPFSCFPTLLDKHKLLYALIPLLLIGGRLLPMM